MSGDAPAAASFTTLAAALADPRRRSVFETLAQGPLSVGEIAAHQPVTRGAVSQHLKVLLDAGLVDVSARGRQRLYRQRPEALQVLANYAVSRAPKAGESADVVAYQLSKWKAEAPNIDYGALALMMHFTQIGRYVLTSSEEASACVGLSLADVMLLGALRRLGPPYESTPTQLSRTLWITLPGMTKRLGRLEASGLLKRRGDEDDRRSVRLRLTTKGLATLRDLVANHQPPEYHALQQLTTDEREQLSTLLPKLLDLIDRAHGQRRPPYLVR